MRGSIVVWGKMKIKSISRMIPELEIPIQSVRRVRCWGTRLPGYGVLQTLDGYLELSMSNAPCDTILLVYEGAVNVEHYTKVQSWQHLES